VTSESVVEALDLKGERGEYTGIFVQIREGWNSYVQAPELKVVFDSIRGPDAEILRSRQSFFYGKRFRALGRLFPGDVVQFQARIRLGKNGVLRFTNPTRVKRFDSLQQLEIGGLLWLISLLYDWFLYSVPVLSLVCVHRAQL